MPSGEFERARARVVEQLRARHSEIDEAIFARISDQWFDRAGSEDPEYVVGLRAADVAALDYILLGIERSGQSLEPVPVAVSEQARRAARVGVGVDTVLRRYHAGYAVLARFVIQEAERDELLGQGSALGDLLQIVSALVDRLSAAVSKAYNKEIEQAGDTALASEDGQVSGRHAEPDQISQAGQTFSGRPESPLQWAGRMKMSVAAPRERILRAIVEVVAERGCAGASVGLVVERARVSRRTFYELFAGGLEDGLLAVLDMALEKSAVVVSRALEREEVWLDGVRAALAAMLVFLDSEPALARVCMVESLGAGPVVLEHRERVVREFRALVVSRIETEVPEVPPLAAEGVTASVMGVIHARMAANEQGPLIELLGPMMGRIVKPFATNEQTTLEEIRRGDELAARILEQRRSQPPAVVEGPPGVDVALIPPALRDPRAHRARLCLMYVAQQGARGHSPSNQEIGEAIGVSHRGQLAKLLHRLAELGLLVKRTGARGHPNAWSATPAGERVALALADYR
jgi:AcrR family transcriptional regulator